MPSHPDRRTFVDVLRDRAMTTPDRTAFEFLDESAVRRVVSYAELDLRARATAAMLRDHGAVGQRTLLVCPPGPDYVTGFLGCLYAGTVAVPVAVSKGPRGLANALTVAADAGATVALGDRASLTAITSHPDAHATIGSLQAIAIDAVPASSALDWSGPGPRPGDLAFLQYTSGSTGSPKGVMVRHDNLMDNSAAIGRAIDAGPDSRAVSWLPPYHDMGLIGGILQPIYAGFPCTLLAPIAFLRRPFRWLEAMSKANATMSVAPNFGYLECVRRIDEDERAELDLSNWRHALVGAEPVRASTIEAFARSFQECGFRSSAFQPCYGLAEATLFVTGGSAPATGPRRLEVSRRELEQGRADPDPTTAPTTVLIGCGRGQGEDLVMVVHELTGRPCRPGEVGEVWISGPSVTGGYWARPEETARMFGARLAEYGDRAFLRTGDLGFQWDGELFLTGRRKDLIVARGRNHYANDIEQTAAQAHTDLHPGGAAVFSIDDGATERVVLVHEMARGFRTEDAPAVLSAVRTLVAAEHGLALFDVVLVRRGAIPRTTSGKIRRGACRDRWTAGTLATLVTAASTTQPAGRAGGAELVGVVSDVLGLSFEEAGADLPLVGLGLDSLSAIQLAAALRRSFGVDIDADLLLRGTTMGELQQALANRPLATNPEPYVEAGAAGVEPAKPRPATRAQQWMWLLEQRVGASGACHIVGGVRLSGPVDPAVLRQSLDELVSQHSQLRLAFEPVSDSVWVSVRPPETVELPIVDATDEVDPTAHAHRVIGDLASRRFDLARGPLLRAVLVRTGAELWQLGVSAHHIVVDGWSLGLLLRDLGACYRNLRAGRAAPALDRGPQPPAGDGAPLSANGAAAFWRGYLAGARPLDLPLDRLPTEGPTWRGAALPFELDADTVATVKEYAAARQATPFMVLLAALCGVLAHRSGQRDLVIGTPAANRGRPETRDQIGLYVNIVPLRVDASGAPGFEELVARVRASCLAAYPYQDFPFEETLRIVGAGRPGGRAPLVRAVLAMQNLPLKPWQAGDVRAEPFELPPPGAQFELHLTLAERPDGRIGGHALYLADLLDAATVKALLEALRRLLRTALGLARDPGGPDPSLGPGHVMLAHELVERQADRAPKATAVAWEHGSMSYGELEARSNRLAWMLRDAGVGAEDLVAVCLPAGAEQVVALLAVLKAAAAVVALDPDRSTLAARLRDTRARAVLTTRRTVQDLPPGGGSALVCLDDEPHPAAGSPTTRVPRLAFTQGLALVDSRSPRGPVMVSHESIVNWLGWMREAHPLAPEEPVLGRSLEQALWPLSVGATAVVADHRDLVRVARLIRDHGVTTYHVVPSLLRDFLDERGAAEHAGSLRRVLCGDGALSSALAARFQAVLPSTELRTFYGPDEAAMAITARPAGLDTAERVLVPIGQPIAGARVHVLDTRGRPTPIGVPGKVHIGGLPLARGYLHRPALTAEWFVPDPVTAGGRLYRTGDRGRWLVGGDLDLVERADERALVPQTHTAPRNETEGRLAEIWCEVLDLDDVSVTSDFFDLGGHSLMATRIIMRIRHDFGVDVALAGLLSGRLTIERLADSVQAMQIEQSDSALLQEALADLAHLSDEQVAELLAQDQ